MGTGERGFTLIEMVIVVAIVATTVAAGVGLSLASRSFAVSAAATEFDHLLDSARTLAREVQGVTLTFVPDAYGDGTEVRVLAGGPSGVLTPTTLPPLHTRATIEETESLHQAPFAFIVHLTGALGGRPGFRFGDATTAAEVGCPPSGAFHFVIKAAGGSADRYVPCRMTLAAGGPVTLTTWPLAPIAPSPTPCSGFGCTATALPTAPASTASCPPSFTAIAGGCAPGLPTSSGARYHVTITGAPATINVGATSSLTAQATLTNANAVPAGTPASIPVEIQTADATCAATPTGWQPSGSSFTVTGTAAGTCTVSAQADSSAVAGASTDTATVSVTITPAPGATPTPAPPKCDLVENGKCYRRIVDQIGQSFSKYVFPDDGCLSNVGCVYIDSIKQILLQPPFGFQPPVLATDSAHELLFNVLKISSVTRQCQPYSYFSGVPAGNSIQWGGDGTGAPSDAAVGWGKPPTYATENHLIVTTSLSGGFIEPNVIWDQSTTLLSLFETVANGGVSSAYSFTFWSSDDKFGKYIQWYPDFPGCDVAGDPNNLGAEYGIATVELVFEIYQAVP
jgi:prepilin-type N-terminal cleavage/methylation domain-containing protein